MSGYGKPCQWSYLVSNQRFTSFGKLVEFQPVVTFSQGSYFQPIKPEDNTMHDLQQMSWTMRQEFEGVGKEGMTEVRVNAMAARGRREGIPVCRSSSRVLNHPHSPFHYSLKRLLHRLQFRGVNQQTLALRGATIGYFENGPCEKENAMYVWARKDENPFFPSSSRSLNILTRPYPLPLYSLSNAWHRLQIRGVNKQNLTLHGATKGYFYNGLRTRTRTQWTREDMKGRKPFLSSSLTRPDSHISLPLQMHRLQITGVKKQALA